MLEELEGVVIYIVTDTSYKIKGIWKVLSRMHDWTIRVLMEVSIVLTWRNLFH